MRVGVGSELEIREDIFKKITRHKLVHTNLEPTKRYIYIGVSLIIPSGLCQVLLLSTPKYQQTAGTNQIQPQGILLLY